MNEYVIYIYNKEMLFDTLMCVVEPQETGKLYTHEKKDDVTIIYDDEKIMGYNIECASEKLSIDFDGVLMLVEKTFDKEVQTFLEKTLGSIHTGSMQQSFVIGYVEECLPHEDSDKLSVCQVDLGTEKVQIVCGASNIAKGQKVVVATVGCMMPTGLAIVPAVLRKVPSNGMICSARELDLPVEMHKEGIMVLDDNAPIGQLFFEYVKELN